MPDPFASYIRPGYPRISNSDSGERAEIQYVGLASVLKASTLNGGDRPVAGEAWGDYSGTVTVSEYEPLPGTDPEYGIATIICELSFGGTETTIGTVQETAFEIEWVNISRSLYEHPAFSTLTDNDRSDIEAWRQETNLVLKRAWSYQSGADVNELGTLAKRFAAYVARGVESYDDYAPVARKSRTYAGGPPPESDAGEKDAPSGFPNLPSGWEWIKTADRSLRSGGQTRWVRTEEWTGAKKVLLDNDSLYIPTPGETPP